MNSKPLIKALGTILMVCYPFAIYYVIKNEYSFSIILGILFVAILIGYFLNRQKLLFCFGFLILSIAFILRDIAYVKAYPVIMNCSVATFFAISLLKKPFVQVIGEKMKGKLSEKGIVYAKKATYAWVIFMYALTGISCITVFLSTEIWALFNGLVSYILIGLMFAAEFVVRRKVLKNDS